MSKFKTSRTVQLFIDEAQDILQSLNEHFLALERGECDSEGMNEVRRTVHTLKGSSALLGFNNISELAHQIEDKFDEWRNAGLEIGGEQCDYLFQALDKIKAMLDTVLAEEEGEAAATTKAEPKTEPEPKPERRAEPAPPPPKPAPRPEPKPKPAPPPKPPAPAPAAAAETGGIQRIHGVFEGMNSVLTEYYDEAEKLIAALEQELLTYGIQPDEEKIVLGVYKSIIKLKSMSAILGFSDIAEICHEIQVVIEHVKDKAIKLTEGIVDAIFSCVSAIKVLLESIESGESSGFDYSAVVGQLQAAAPLMELKGKMTSQAATDQVIGQFDLNPLALPHLTFYEKRRIVESKIEHFQIYEGFLRLNQDCLDHGYHPFEMARNLESVGEVLVCMGLDEGSCDEFTFVIYLISKEDVNIVSEKFDSIADLGSVKVRSINLSSSEDIQEMKRRKADEGARKAEKTSEEPESEDNEAPAPARPSATGGPVQVSAPRGASSASKLKSLTQKDTKKQTSTVRVETQRLDDVMNLVGELVISKIRLEQRVNTLSNLVSELSLNRGSMSKLMRELDGIFDVGGIQELREGRDRLDGVTNSIREILSEYEDARQFDIERLLRVQEDISRERGSLARAADNFDMYSGLFETLKQTTDTIALIKDEFEKTAEGFGENTLLIGRHTSELQKEVMKVRMLPVSRVFNKFPRTVRDLARKLGKKIELVIKGEETELDKTLIEEIEDPLMHLIRNSIDHGIEAPDVRKAAGKPDTGNVFLEAYHEGNNIVIEVRDDGKGLHTDKIVDKAVEKGIITRDEADKLDDQEAIKLIFAHGFSTAKEVTDLSGRGVGMDVVKTNISKLKGMVDVKSTPGEGSTFILKLPLTLAIIQALMVRISGRTYVIPLESVVETIRISKEDIYTVEGSEVIRVRDSILSLVRLNEVFNHPTEDTGAHNLPVVIVGLGTKRIGLLVDKLVGKQEIVIKSLGALLKNVKDVAGATIHEHGQVALIVDVASIINSVATVSRRTAGDLKPAHIITEKKKTVMVVDDSASGRKSQKELLENYGFRVRLAKNGQEALEMLEEEKVNLVITDVIMPYMDGYEFTTRIKSQSRTRSIPVIMVTGDRERSDKVRGMEVGVDAYLIKPFGDEELIKTIERLLQ